MLTTNNTYGLTSAEAEQRLQQYGANALIEESLSPWLRFARFFWGPIPWMIEIAAGLSFTLSDWTDFGIIATMLFANAGIGFWQEYKADNAIQLLKQRLAPNARVLRDGEWTTLAAHELVPGDRIILNIGNIVPADAKLIGSDYLSIDESALTGESLPVEKREGNDIYSGAIIRQGNMQAVVTATGMNTYFGRTARLVQTAQPRSHFQQAVLRIGNFLIAVALALVILIFTIAVERNAPVSKTLQFALILTIAAIPVAMPAVLSVTMAVGAEKLARLKAIVSRLVAIEELAGMDILCADKTGTLTKNELTLVDVWSTPGVQSADVIITAVLATNAAQPDAIDKAIQNATARPTACKILSFMPFDPVHKRTEAEIDLDGAQFRVSKGASQAIIELTNPDPVLRLSIDKKVEDLAAIGYRALAVAHTESDGKWRFMGVLAISDPPREDSAATLQTTKDMGIAVKMITGDHEAIARQIAGQLGLGTDILSADEVFGDGINEAISARTLAASGVARVLPEHKFKIVQALQTDSHIVGMTGDGVNDAPALKQSDVGIAVSGATDAACAAADLVLTAPGLSVITAAIEESRRIFERMTGYAIYRIAETIRVLLFMTLSILIFNFYPVTAVMIVILALFNDLPIMMIAYDNASVAPRPVRWDMRLVLGVATALGISGVCASFLLFWFVNTVLHLPRDTIQTLIFLKLLVAGHMMIYVTRNQSWFFARPWPSWKLFVTSEATQLIGTLMAVYGVFVHPIGWHYALAVWGYALAWLPISSVFAIFMRYLLSGKHNAPC